MVNVLFVTDAYPPMRTSGATQMFDLGQAFAREGNHVSVIIPQTNQSLPVKVTQISGCTIFGVRAFQTKDVAYWRRTLAEFINPFWIWMQLKKNPLFRAQKINGIIWYYPSIFGEFFLLLRKVRIFHGLDHDISLLNEGPA